MQYSVQLGHCRKGLERHLPAYQPGALTAACPAEHNRFPLVEPFLERSGRSHALVAAYQG